MALSDDYPGQAVPNQEDEDPFVSLLGLEDKYQLISLSKYQPTFVFREAAPVPNTPNSPRFYQEGHAEGVSDGARAGFAEGQVFGIEKGFEKYLAMGRLHGRAVVWAGRLQKHQPPPEGGGQPVPPPPIAGGGEPSQRGGEVAQDPAFPQYPRPPSLPANPRLEKHIKTLYALTEPVSLSTENTEDSVSDFDDRLKRALAKVKVIEKLIGESDLGYDGDRALSGDKEKKGGDGSIEDVDILRVRH
ncbi:MAG: hypothetical protein M1839_004472 [Geoglossum umbratile]|nr:MAG: hypothetical protein M1839_004472 [Geoglossum umbratile]